MIHKEQRSTNQFKQKIPMEALQANTQTSELQPAVMGTSKAMLKIGQKAQRTEIVRLMAEYD